MSFAFMPWYTGDYKRDTSHLSCSEHGIYLLLLSHCWDQRGPIPLDERKIMGICNARSSDEIEAMRRVLNEFFVRMDDGWYNRRIQREIERANAISGVRSAAGKLGAKVRLKQLPSKRRAIAKQEPLPLPPQPQLQLQKSNAMSGKKPDAVLILEFLNQKTGKNFRPVRANLEMIDARLKDGATIDEMRAVIAKKCREWASDEKMAMYLRPATLFGRKLFAQYQGELV